jgi:hypothetical protein
MNAAVQRARVLARMMVYLEQHARAAQRAGKVRRAAEVWACREEMQHNRSVLMRRLWAERRESDG